MNLEEERYMLNIAREVANKSRLKDKEEAYSIALFGIAKGLSKFDSSKNVKLATYMYSCAKFEVWAEWRKLNRLRRGKGIVIVSLDELNEKGWEI